MEIKESFILSITKVFPIFKMKPVFKYEEESPLFAPAGQVNILNSFSHTLEGNVVFGCSRPLGLKIASLAKGKETGILNDEAKRVIGDIVTLTVSVAISKYRSVNTIYISPPVFVTGDNVSFMISGVKTTRLVFQLDEALFSIVYSIEPKEVI